MPVRVVTVTDNIEEFLPSAGLVHDVQTDPFHDEPK